MKIPNQNRLIRRASASLIAIGMLAAATLQVHAAVLPSTFAFWNFDQGTPGAPFSTVAGATLDVPDQGPSGFWLSGWNEAHGPSWSTLGDTPTGAGLSSRHNVQDAFSGAPNNTALNTWSPLVWTIETSIRMDTLVGWRTFVGRDGSSHATPESNFYLQKVGAGATLNHIRLNFATVAGPRIVIDSNFAMVANQWYHVAAVSDGTTVSLFVDQFDGHGAQLAGSAAFATPGAPGNALATTGGVWTFGRGWFNTWLVDHIVGNMDNIRLSSAALGPHEIIPEPSTYALLFGLGALGVILLRRRRK